MFGETNPRRLGPTRPADANGNPVPARRELWKLRRWAELVVAAELMSPSRPVSLVFRSPQKPAHSRTSGPAGNNGGTDRVTRAKILQAWK